MKILVVIPTYNERENIKLLVKEIFSLAIAGLEVLIIDDNSIDGTGQLADELSKAFPVQVIHRSSKQGLGTAYLTGFAYAIEHNFAIVFEMDADFSHQPQEIPNFLREITDGYDLVIGSRRVSGGKVVGWSAWRHFCSHGASLLSRLCLGLETKDVTSGFRAYKLRALQSLPLGKIRSNGYAFLEETLFWAEKEKLKIKEIPIVFIDRERGKSKLNFKIIFEFFLTIFRLMKEKYL